MSGSRRRWARGTPWGAVALGSVLAVAAVVLVVVATRGPAQPASMSDRVQSVAATLRCPVCQNLSVADSPSGLAGEMRSLIRRRLEEGSTPEEIRAEFVQAYGEWVLLAPPRRGLNLVAWIAPAFFVLGGVVVMAGAVRRWSRGGAAGGSEAVGDERTEAAPLSPEDRVLLDRALSTGSDGETAPPPW